MGSQNNPVTLEQVQKRFKNLKNGEFLSLLLYGECGVGVEDDGGADGL